MFSTESGITHLNINPVKEIIVCFDTVMNQKKQICTNILRESSECKRTILEIQEVQMLRMMN